MAFQNKWPDPAQDGFDRKYIIEYSRAKAYEEIFKILETSEAMVKNLGKEIEKIGDKPAKNYAI